jgi:hypothetical protein
MNRKKTVRWLTEDLRVIGKYWETVTRKGYTEREKELMLAVLKDALLTYRRNLSSRNALFREVDDWLFEKGSGRLFSFEMVCEVLGLSPNRIRAGLLDWKVRSPGKPTIQGKASRPIEKSSG